MTGTASDRPRTDGEISTHGRSHTAPPERKARTKARVDPTDASPQARKSHPYSREVTSPLPRNVTFSGLSIGRPERDTERGEINKNTPAENGPEPVGAIAERVLDDLAARRREALNRLRRQQPAIRNKEQS